MNIYSSRVQGNPLYFFLKEELGGLVGEAGEAQEDLKGEDQEVAANQVPL